VREGAARVILRRETVDDQFRLEVVSERTISTALREAPTERSEGER
jgi:hypothetical protein